MKLIVVLTHFSTFLVLACTPINTSLSRDLSTSGSLGKGMLFHLELNQTNCFIKSRLKKELFECAHTLRCQINEDGGGGVLGVS